MPSCPVPELCIVGEALWQAVKERQGELMERYATVIETVRSAQANRLNGPHWPRHLLSVLLVRSVRGGPSAVRGQDCCGRLNHVMNGTCADRGDIYGVAIEERMLAGLKETNGTPARR